jgi:hypothetical protein
MYAAKMKKDRVLRNKSYDGDNLKEEAKIAKEKAIRKCWKSCDK